MTALYHPLITTSIYDRESGKVIEQHIDVAHGFGHENPEDAHKEGVLFFFSKSVIDGNLHVKSYSGKVIQIFHFQK